MSVTAPLSGEIVLTLDERNPSDFFVKLRWLARANEWDDTKTMTKCLLFIGLRQTWLASRLEKDIGNLAEGKVPKVDQLQAMVELVLAPKTVRHTFIDEFEKISLQSSSVYEVRERLENNFRLALPEAETASVELMVKRQLIKACPAAWQQRLKEAEFKNVDAMCDKIFLLQKVTAEVTVPRMDRTGDTLARATTSEATCRKCGLRGHFAKECRTRCFKCKAKGHVKAQCPQLREKGATQIANERSRRVDLLLEDAVLVKSSPEESDITVNVFIEGVLHLALVDCGSYHNLITVNTLRNLNGGAAVRPTSVRLGAINKTSLKVLGEVSLTTELGTRECELDFIVIEEMSDPLIIGKKGADQLRIVVWFQTRRTLPTHERKLQELGERFEDLFARSQYDVGRVELEHSIQVTSDQPIVKRQYKVPVHFQERARITLEKMVEAGIIAEGESAYSSPAFMIPKGKTEELRLVIDYRELNKVTVDDPFPIPDMLAVVNEAAKFRFFSTIDIRGGYWHFKMAEVHRAKTAFVIMDRQYVCIAMPMGLKNAPKTFARGLLLSLAKLREELGKRKFLPGVHYAIASFYDDIVLATHDEDVHLLVLEEFCKRFAVDGWKLNKAKSKWMVEEAEILGHLVTKGKVTPRPSFKEEMRTWEVPGDQKELRTFLGFAGFHSRMIKNYSSLTAPLNRLIGDVPYEWGMVEQEAFDKLKELLSSEPVIRPFQVNVPTVLITDASGTGWGAVLEQENQPVEYCSGRWNTTESKWSTTRKEFRALVNAVQKWKYFLIGSQFTVITDHQAIAKGFRHDCDDPVLFRWARKLDGYSMVVQHRPGLTIAHADALSRKPFTPHRRVSQREVWADECRRDEILEFLRAKLRNDTRVPPESADPAELQFWMQQLSRGSLKTEGDNVLYKGVKVVPQNMRLEIFRAAHCHPMAGHMGSKRTQKRIREFYYWYNMGKDVNDLKKGCLICAKNNVKRQKSSEPRLTVGLVEVPLCQWAMDFLGPLPVSRNGYRNILVVTDLFTKWVELFPTETQTAKETTKCIIELVLRYSIPSSLLSDQGTNFTADLTQALLKALDIKHLRTSPYHPQTDGQTERFNAALMQYIRKYVEDDPEHWDKHLQHAAYAYRTSVHSVTGFSPTAEAKNVAGEACIGCVWIRNEMNQARNENARLRAANADLEERLEKQVSANAQLIAHYTAEILRRTDLEKELAGAKLAALGSSQNMIVGEGAEIVPTSCAYLIGEEILDGLYENKHLSGLLGKTCVLRTKQCLIARHFEMAEKLIREGTAEKKHVLFEIGKSNLRDENFRSWKAKELGDQSTNGLGKLLANKNVATITWTNLPEKGDLAHPASEVNRVIEEWIETQDPEKVSLFNLRGLYQNRILFDSDNLTKIGQAEAAKKLTAWYVTTVQLDTEEEENLRALMKKRKDARDAKGIILVSETWLMNEEVPPKISQYEWLGSNREGKTGKHAKAGVGILIPQGIGRVISTERGRDFIATKVEIQSSIWLFCSIYVAHERGRQNGQLFENITNVLSHEHDGKTHVVIGGDMNAHITQFSEQEDARGWLVKNFASQNGLIIVNTSDKCEGKFTRKGAVLDYVLCNTSAYRKLQQMVIDEKRQITQISDHNLITAIFQIAENRGDKKKLSKKLNLVDRNRAALGTKASLRTKLLRDEPVTYEILKYTIQENIRKSSRMVRVSNAYPTQSREISRLHKEKKALGKEWRRAGDRGDLEKQHQLAGELNDVRRKIYDQVEREVANSNRKLYDYIIRAPRHQRAKRFWEYTRKEDRGDRKPAAALDESGREIKDGEMEDHLTEVLSNLLECDNAESPTTDPKRELKVPMGSQVVVDADMIAEVFGK
ncbi:uncharacterized protein LOC108865118, partial [Galendromus occidentalis]|uniref:RNA-directed DNA polymerase n=1 Tax=Galendromus occidentalis TaxID=34638 RepID=A0AAJ7L6G4_9ACAR